MVRRNEDLLTEIKISKKTVYEDKTSGEYTVRYLYRPIYDNNILRSIKKTVLDLLDTAFVILFPAGISDIILGFASNDPQIGINSTGQIIMGFVFLAISALLLFYSIRTEQRKLNKTKTKETDTMRLILKKVYEPPLETGIIRVIFNDNEPSVIYE